MPTPVLIRFKVYLATTMFWLGQFRKNFLSFLNILSGLGCVAVLVLLVLDFGFHLSETNKSIFSRIHTFILIYFMVDIGIRFVLQKRRLFYFLSHPTDLVVFYPLLYVFAWFPSKFSFFIGQFALLLLVAGRVQHIKKVMEFLRVKPAQLFIFGFLFTIFIGSLLLSLPVSSSFDEGISYVDALFTAFSAVCVTGLSVTDIGNTFTFFGQLVILLLIQVGGLGMMTFSVLLSLVLKRKISQKVSMEIQESYSAFSIQDAFQAIVFIFKVTFIVEALGAILLFFSWKSDFYSFFDLVFYSIFHSISGFCNAGFSLFSNNLEYYSSHYSVMAVMCVLVTIGGFGFPVLKNIAEVWFSSKKFTPFRLETKMAVAVSMILLVLGTVFIFMVERTRSLENLSLIQQLGVSLFQSVNARTAGFNVVNIGLFHPATLVALMMLMVIGASPGSTGGGIKTTTLGLIAVSFWRTLKSSKRIVLGKRTLSTENILRAFMVFLIAIFVISWFFCWLLIQEDADATKTLFEVISAFGTVGYSVGLTTELSNLGKLLIMIVMFIGRIGPLTMAYALFQPKGESRVHYPEEKVFIG